MAEKVVKFSAGCHWRTLFAPTFLTPPAGCHWRLAASEAGR